ncbi:MAG: ArnT family glycosyltransferase [Marmoricola sp.]
MRALPRVPAIRRPTSAALRNPLLGIFLVALVARVVRAQVGGGFTQPNGYDPGVYYAGAAGLANGRVPYRDFTFVHPPGIALLEAPFALLGRATTDLTGYVAATIAVVVLASLNAVLVVLVSRAMGLPQRAALVGGLFYALWTNAVGFETTARLEPVGNFFLLCGLLAFHRALLLTGRRADLLGVLAGVGLGAAVCVKLWWLVPVAAYVAWQLVVERRFRASLATLAGGALALVVVNLPFFVLARGAMWDSIVRDQLGRQTSHIPHARIFSYLTVGNWATDESHAGQVLTIVVGLVVVALMVQRAWRTPVARPLALVLLVQLAQLWFQPIWFTFYSDFTTVALCLLIAAAFGAPRPERPEQDAAPWMRRNWLPSVLVVALAVNLAVIVATWEPGADASPTPFPRAALTQALAHVRCVESDQPMGLIQVNALSRSFQNRCPAWVDVVGRRLRFNRVVGPPNQPGAPTQWDALVARHLRRTDALLLTRPPAAIGLFPRTFQRLQRYGLLIDVGGYPVYRMPGRR